VQLAKLDAGNLRRSQIVSKYNALLNGIVTTPPPIRDGFGSSWHLYHIRTRSRDELAEHLAARSICTGVHYYPIHLYPCYGPQARLPVSEEAFEQILTLPLFPDLTDAQVEQIAGAVRQFAGARSETLIPG
jgi:perosamine synthetase